MIYFDSAYIAKCYLPEPGHKAVMALAENEGAVASSILARIEVSAVFHRKLREKELNASDYREICAQFAQDCQAGVWQFLPFTAALAEIASSMFEKARPGLFLRSADCLHLVTALEAEFSEIHSNDRHLLAAAPFFGLRGVNVIPSGT